MTYCKIQIANKTFWTSEPKNWDELAFTIANESQFMAADPTSKEVDINLLNMFL